MEIWAGLFSILLAVVGVFYGQAGERATVTRVGYLIVLLILISGTVDLVSTVLNSQAVEKENKRLQEAVQIANRHIVIQNIDLDRRFESTHISLSINVWGDDLPKDFQDKFMSHEVALVAPFWPKQPIGRPIADLEVMVGESTVRGFSLFSSEQGLRVIQKDGRGEGALKYEYFTNGHDCEAISDSRKCQQSYLKGEARYREGVDNGSSGVSLDISSDVLASRTVSDLLNHGTYLSVKVHDAYAQFGWWQLYARSRFTMLWRDYIEVGISLSQSRTKTGKLSKGEKCAVNYSMPMALISNRNDQSWIKSKILMFGFGLGENDFEMTFTPKGIISQTICSGYS